MIKLKSLLNLSIFKYEKLPLLQKMMLNYQELLKEIKGRDLLSHQGVLYVWIDSQQQPSVDQVNIRSQSGIEQHKLTGEQIRELEPNLSTQIKGGWHFPKAHHTLNSDIILSKLMSELRV